MSEDPRDEAAATPPIPLPSPLAPHPWAETWAGPTAHAASHLGASDGPEAGSPGSTSPLAQPWAPVPPTTVAGASTLPRGRRRLAASLAIAGEGLLTIGILLGLFVVWELWWTDIGASRRQHEEVANLDWAVSAILAPEPVPPESTNSASTTPAPPIYLVVPAALREANVPPPDEAVPGRAETFATLYVPRWGYDYVSPISEGINRRTVLDVLGIGHYPETELPGGWGNFAVAGHRTTYGKPFANIDTLEEGDALVVRTEARWYVYRVTESHIVSPAFTAALADVPGDEAAAANGRYITLTTCHPRYSAQQRYVVYGVLVYWADAVNGYPPELVPPGARTVEKPSAASAAATEGAP